MKLLIISPTPHGIDDNGTIRGHGPTIKEINYLSTLFTEIVHLAPLYKNRNIESYLPYDSKHIEFVPLKPAGGPGLQHKYTIPIRASEWISTIKKHLNSQRYDLIHLRTPSSLSLTTLLYFKTIRVDTLKWIKFAGNWEKNSTESIATKIQKLLLKSGVHNAFITVNYIRNLPSRQFIPFPNPSFYLDEYLENKRYVINKRLEAPIQITFVGNLYKTKGIMEALKVVKELMKLNIKLKFHIIGSGPMEEKAKEFVLASDLKHHVVFHGSMPHKKVFEVLKDSQFLLFPTYFNEGWPKVLSEAMSMGTVPITGAVSLIPDVINFCKCGFSAPANNIEAFVNAIHDYVQHPEKWKTASIQAYKYAVFFTYEYYGLKLQQILSKFLGKNLINEKHFGKIKESIRNLSFII